MALSANTAKAAARAIRQGHGISHDDGDACLELASRLDREAEAAQMARQVISIIDADQDQMAKAMAEAEALVRADQGKASPQDLRDLADKAVRMAGGLREHIWAARLLDAWAAADWLGDLAQEVKDGLPVSSEDILASVEGQAPAPFPPVQGPRERWHLPPDQEAGQ